MTVPGQSDTDHATPLLMSVGTFDELWLRAQFPGTASATMQARARAMRAALAASEHATATTVRVRCCAVALAFISDCAPDIARSWPAVFGGDVDVPRALVLIDIAGHAIGQTVAGVLLEADSLRVDFESGDALVVAADGRLDWRSVT